VTAASSLLILILCGTVAVSLEQEQARTAAAHEEDIHSRRAAADLEEGLAELIAAHQEKGRALGPLQERILDYIAVIEQFADKDEERRLVRRIKDSFQTYLEGGRRAVGLLTGQILPACQRLRDFNAGQIEESGKEHRAALRRLVWGLALVGGLGSAAGLVLGYGLARGLSRTIHQLLIRVQGASELLEQELPPIAVAAARQPDSIHDSTQDLVRQVEQVVRKLQEKDRQVQRAERLAALGQLAAGLAHEVRNPLTSIKLLVQTTLEDPDAGGLTNAELELIEQEVLRVERSLQSFLDYARPPRLERTACDLERIVKVVWSLVRARAEQQGVTLEVSAPPEPVVIDADAALLRQVVLNLALNALDAMPDGGVVRARLHWVGPDTVELRLTDTGPGIRADVLPRLFEPFTSSKETGLGLGLVISRRIVEDHGGTIEAGNGPDGGACLVVRLPRRHQENSREVRHANTADRR
jgi:two-component system sensor histidine kinase HydH